MIYPLIIRIRTSFSYNKSRLFQLMRNSTIAQEGLRPLLQRSPRNRIIHLRLLPQLQRFPKNHRVIVVCAHFECALHRGHRHTVLVEKMPTARKNCKDAGKEETQKWKAFSKPQFQWYPPAGWQPPLRSVDHPVQPAGLHNIQLLCIIIPHF